MIRLDPYMRRTARNARMAPEVATRCYLCRRPIRSSVDIVPHVHVHGGGVVVLLPDEVAPGGPEADLGLQAVGHDCARILPTGYALKLHEWHGSRP